MLLWCTCLLHTLYTGIYCIIFRLEWPSAFFFSSCWHFMKWRKKKRWLTKQFAWFLLKSIRFKKKSSLTEINSLEINLYQLFWIFWYFHWCRLNFDCLKIKFKRSKSNKLKMKTKNCFTVSIFTEQLQLFIATIDTVSICQIINFHEKYSFINVFLSFTQYLA